jgi:hypothetical protein
MIIQKVKREVSKYVFFFSQTIHERKKVLYSKLMI